MEPECGGGLLLPRHVTPLSRRNMVYFSSGAYAYNRASNTKLRRVQIDRQLINEALVVSQVDSSRTSWSENRWAPTREQVGTRHVSKLSDPGAPSQEFNQVRKFVGRQIGRIQQQWIEALEHRLDRSQTLS